MCLFPVCANANNYAKQPPDTLPCIDASTPESALTHASERSRRQHDGRPAAQPPQPIRRDSLNPERLVSTATNFSKRRAPALARPDRRAPLSTAALAGGSAGAPCSAASASARPACARRRTLGRTSVARLSSRPNAGAAAGQSRGSAAAATWLSAPSVALTTAV